MPREPNAALIRLLLEHKGALKLNDDHAVRLLAHVVNLPNYELTSLLLEHGAAVNGSPLSGGYAGAKAAVKFIADYAAIESKGEALGISFVSVLPRLTPASR